MNVCRSPLYAGLLQARHQACLMLGLDEGLCDGVRPPPAGADACAAPGFGGGGAPSWSLLAFAAALALAALAAAWGALRRLHSWLTVRQGSAMAAAAAGALEALRAAAPARRPPAPHVWSPAADAAAADAGAPLLCAVCFGGVGVPAAPGGAAARCCAACGSVCHEGCARHAGAGCRPLATPPDEPTPHFWLPAGTARDALQDTGGGDAGGGGGGGAGRRTCVYCGDPCSGDAYASEPAWRCACCGDVAHVQCFCDAHPELPGVSAAFARLVGAAAAGGASAAAGEASETTGGAEAGALPPTALGADGGGAPPSGAPSAAASPARAVSISRSWVDFLSGAPGTGGAGAGAGANGLVGGSSGDEFDFIDPEAQARRTRRRRRRAIAGRDAAAADACSLGPLGRLAVPPNCVRAVLRGSAGSAGQLAGGGDSSATLDEAAAAAAAAAAPPAEAVVTAPGALAARAGEPPRRRGKRGKRRRAPWWRLSVFGPRPPSHADYRVEGLPPGARPVLVFVNARSGPQTGEALRLEFLRLLHPLQVVALPKEAPGPALEMFARVPGLRVAVVGGDGSAGWVMSCLDELAERHAAERAAAAAGGGGGAAAPAWRPPPVAVVPLGTGNDLARVLGWGGGAGAWRAAGAAGVLAAVAEATVALLDRWDVALEAAPPPARPPGGGAAPGGALAALQVRAERAATGAAAKLEAALHHLASPRAADAAAAAAAAAAADGPAEQPRTPSPAAPGSHALPDAGGAGGSPPPALQPPPQPPVSTRKVLAMSNYLGIGVDAKVALQFHAMREAHPQWFQSQLGNKVLYTGMGARDILGAAWLRLARKVAVTVDGAPVPLPPDIEGLLVANIGSYMGGVDLWGTGVDGEAGGGGRGGGTGSAGGAEGGGAGARPRQLVFDGLIEVVGVYGSWHLGQLQVGLARAVRLRQGRRVEVTTAAPLPMQVDGEPFVQPAGRVEVRRRGQALVLRRVASRPLARVVAAVGEVLEGAEAEGVITPAAHGELQRRVAARVQPLLQAA